MFFVYILFSEKAQKYYVGHTSDIAQRLADHNMGRSGYTSAYTPWELVWSVEMWSKREAVILEKKLKNLSGDHLIAFMKKYS